MKKFNLFFLRPGMKKSLYLFLTVLGISFISCSQKQPAFNMDHIVLNVGDSTLLEISHIEKVLSVSLLHPQASICELKDLGKHQSKHSIMVYGKNVGKDTICTVCHYVMGTAAYEDDFYIPVEVID